jgi:hypothetical protein
MPMAIHSQGDQVAVLIGRRFKAFHSLLELPLAAGRVAAAYAIGTTSTVWLVSRVSVF